MSVTLIKRLLSFSFPFLIIIPASAFCLDRIELPLPRPEPRYVEGELIVKFKEDLTGKLTDKGVK